MSRIFSKSARRRLFVLTLSIIPMSAHADFQKGVDAYLQKNFAEAFRQWLPLAESGDPDAARNIGRLFNFGEGIPKDFVKARYWYGIGAKKCNATAMNNLGLLLLNGEGGSKDPVQAFRLFEEAAYQGLPEDADAMGNIAGLCLSGNGTQQNIVEAYKWYVLFTRYTTNQNSKNVTINFMNSLEKDISSVQKAEAIRRADNFQKRKCIPK